MGSTIHSCRCFVYALKTTYLECLLIHVSESFPLVYGNIYHFNLGELGLAFLSVLVGLVFSAIVYCMYFYYIADPHIAEVGMFAIPPEYRVRPGLVATFFIPIGLFIFGLSLTLPRGRWIYLHCFPQLGQVAVQFTGLPVWLVSPSVSGGCSLLFVSFITPFFLAGIQNRAWWDFPRRVSLDQEKPWANIC